MTSARFAPALALFVLTTCALIAACGNPAPQCAATADAYTVCSDQQVWECPVATADALAAKKAIDDACAKEADPVKCTLNAKYQMYPMTLKADCKGGGEKCVESTPTVAGGSKSASCQKP